MGLEGGMKRDIEEGERGREGDKGGGMDEKGYRGGREREGEVGEGGREEYESREGEWTLPPCAYW